MAVKERTADDDWLRGERPAFFIDKKHLAGTSFFVLTFTCGIMTQDARRRDDHV